MQKKVREVSVKLYHRPLSAEDAALLRANAKARHLGARVAEQLKERDLDIVKAAVEEFRRRHPEKASKHAMMWEKTYRDMVMNIRYCQQCVALNDEEYGKQVVWWWFRTILNAFNFGDGFVEEGYRILQEQVRVALPAEEAEAVTHMLAVMIETLNFNHAEAAQELQPA